MGRGGRGGRWIRVSVCVFAVFAESCADSKPEARPDPDGLRATALGESLAPGAPVEDELTAARSNEEHSPSATPDLRSAGQPWIFIDIAQQQLTLFAGRAASRDYPISTSRLGPGNESGSLKTPLGRHRVAEKFGDGAAVGTIFRARANTGGVATILTTPTDVEEDLVLTRILWLEGLEPGTNQGPGIDSHDRYIYIHGTNEEGLIGTPASHGCIRMRNADVIDLFDRVSVGTEVLIEFQNR